MVWLSMKRVRGVLEEIKILVIRDDDNSKLCVVVVFLTVLQPLYFYIKSVDKQTTKVKYTKKCHFNSNLLNY